jgi:hypothetical protein
VADSDDDWRVTLSVSHPLAGPPPSSLSEAEEDIRRQVGRGVGVGAGEDQIFLYGGTEAATGEAERVGRDVLAQHGISAESAVHRWHPIEERWETRDVPMPQTAAERQAEHQRLVQAETAESLATGQAQWEVRVELGSHRQAVALARKLEGEGRAIVRRWKFLLVGATNEDEARELAGQLKREVPADAAVKVEMARVGWPFPPS